jgi:hypothetical protein
MHRTRIVEGHFVDPRRIELDEPVSDVQGRVQVTVRPITQAAPGSPEAVLAAMRAEPHLDPADIDELERMIRLGRRSF